MKKILVIASVFVLTVLTVSFASAGLFGTGNAVVENDHRDYCSMLGQSVCEEHDDCKWQETGWWIWKSFKCVAIPCDSGEVWDEEENKCVEEGVLDEKNGRIAYN